MSIRKFTGNITVFLKEIGHSCYLRTKRNRIDQFPVHSTLTDTQHNYLINEATDPPLHYLYVTTTKRNDFRVFLVLKSSVIVNRNLFERYLLPPFGEQFFLNMHAI